MFLFIHFSLVLFVAVLSSVFTGLFRVVDSVAQGLRRWACERAPRIKHCGSRDKRYGILAALRVVSSSLSLILSHVWPCRWEGRGGNRERQLHSRERELHERELEKERQVKAPGKKERKKKHFFFLVWHIRGVRYGGLDPVVSYLACGRPRYPNICFSFVSIERMSHSPILSLLLLSTFDYTPGLSYDYQALLQWHGNKKKGGKFIEARPVKKAATSAEFLFCSPLFLMIISGGVSARGFGCKSRRLRFLRATRPTVRCLFSQGRLIILIYSRLRWRISPQRAQGHIRWTISSWITLRGCRPFLRTELSRIAREMQSVR